MIDAMTPLAPAAPPFATVAIRTRPLWLAAHEALLAGNWSAARTLLDALAQRRDVTDILSSVWCYRAGCGARLAPAYAHVLQARIDAVNAIAAASAASARPERI